MGEFATRKSDGERIKIGTCSDLYYLRFDDRDKIDPLDHNVNPWIDAGLRFRVPVPEEDHAKPGEYTDCHEGYILNAHYQPSTAPALGVLQIHDRQSGILISLTCHHGESLPDLGTQASARFNGRSPRWYALSSIKTHPVPEEGEGYVRLLPVIKCRFCRETWREEDWDTVLPYVNDDTLARRLISYRDRGLFRLSDA